MSRIPVTLVPAGSIPRDPNLVVTMQPAAIPAIGVVVVAPTVRAYRDVHIVNVSGLPNTHHETNEDSVETWLPVHGVIKNAIFQEDKASNYPSQNPGAGTGLVDIGLGASILWLVVDCDLQDGDYLSTTVLSTINNAAVLGPAGVLDDLIWFDPTTLPFDYTGPLDMDVPAQRASFGPKVAAIFLPNTGWSDEVGQVDYNGNEQVQIQFYINNDAEGISALAFGPSLTFRLAFSS